MTVIAIIICAIFLLSTGVPQTILVSLLTLAGIVFAAAGVFLMGAFGIVAGAAAAIVAAVWWLINIPKRVADHLIPRYRK